MTAYRKERRDARYYRAVARQIVAHEQRPTEYVPPAQLLRAIDRAPNQHREFLSYLPGARSIDDAIDAWHDNPDPHIGSLHEYLGLTWDEYKTWHRCGYLPAAALLYDPDRPIYRKLT